MATLANIRSARLIEGDAWTLQGSQAAFLGLYNSGPHLNSIKNWLGDQTDKSLPLLVVDNSSTDNSWTTAKALIGAVYPNVVFIQNPINLGGYGSLFATFDLLNRFEWVTTFHQDDTYPANHLATHLGLTLEAAPKVAIISSEQESVLPSGRKLGFPRASWLMTDNPDPTTLFLANLKHHTLPFSGASFRLQMLREIDIPWHSTAFPDTEIVLRMLPRWTGLVDSKSVVRYLENPRSESHSINSKERSLGAFLALTRVFASSSFLDICKLVPPGETDAFVNGVTSSIIFRVRDENYAATLRAVALEAMFQEFGPHPSIVEQLEPIYSNITAVAATTLLHRLHTFPKSDGTQSCSSLNANHTSPRAHRRTYKKKRRSSGLLLSSLVGILPRMARRTIWVVTIRLLKVLRIRNSWDFDWRKD